MASTAIWCRLGKNPTGTGKGIFTRAKPAAAYKEWVDRLGSTGEVLTFAELCDRYRLDELSKKTKATREQSDLAIRRLIPVFGPMPPSTITVQHAYGLFDALIKSDKSIATARACVVTLRIILTMAVRWA